MLYLIVVILLVLICGSVVAYGLMADTDGPLYIAGGIIAAIVLIGGGTLLASYHQVGSHQVGVVQGISGVVQGSFGPGTHTTAPWDSVTTQDTGIQKVAYNRLTCVSKDSQDVFVDVQVNYHLDPAAVVALYQTTGGDWFDKFVPGAIQQATKEETVKFNTVDLAPERAVMSQDILSNLRQLLEPHSIHIDSVYLLNVDYSQQFKSAIEQKQVQSQETARATLKAQEQRNLAAGDRDAAIIRAQGQAKSNALLAHSLTPNVIRYIAIQKLNPNVKIITPQGGSILNLGNLGR